MLRLIFLYKSRKSLSSYMVLSYKIPFLCQAYNTPKVVTLCETYSNLTYYRDLSCTNCVAVGYYYNTKSNYTEYVHPTFPEVYVLQVSAWFHFFEGFRTGEYLIPYWKGTSHNTGNTRMRCASWVYRFFGK